jgi:hypothetical protein
MIQGQFGNNDELFFEIELIASRLGCATAKPNKKTQMLGFHCRSNPTYDSQPINRT